MTNKPNPQDVVKIIAELALVSAKAVSEFCLKKLKEKEGKKNA